MAAQLSTPEPIRAVLIYQAAELNDSLRAALLGAGVAIAHTSRAEAIVNADIAAFRPEVFLINLDPDLEDHLDDVTDMLARFDRPVIFNESAASNSLSGWDQARWARHLAAKIRGEVDAHPPRPPGAPIIESKPRVTPAPIPSAVVTPAPIKPSPTKTPSLIEPTPEPVAKPLAPTVKLPIIEAPKKPAVADSVPITKLAPTVEMPALKPAVAESSHDRATDLDIDATLAALFGDETPKQTPASAVSESPTLDSAISDAWLEQAAQPPASESALIVEEIVVAESVDLSDEWSSTVDLGDVQELGVAPIAEPVAASAFELEAELGAFDFAEASPPTASVSADDLDKLFNITAEAEPIPTAAATEEWTDLDSLLDNLAKQPIDSKPESPAPSAAKTPIAEKPMAPQAPAARGIGENKPAPMEWSLEPLDGEGLAEIPQPGRAKFDLGREIKPETTPPKPAAAAPVASSEADAELAGFDFFFEPDQGATSDASAVTAPVVQADDGLTDFNFDLGADLSAPASSGGSAVVADLDGLFADLDAPPAESAIPGLDRVWILGASIGGPDAVRAFLEKLSNKVQAGFIVAQHMGAEFLDLMISQLAKASPVPVKLAQSGMSLRNGEVIVAPVGKRLTLDGAGKVVLTELSNDSPYSPSIDQIMLDTSDRMGSRCSAIIFSGMASDAIEGAKYIAAKGGRVWVQDPSTCVISSMIDGAQAAGVVSYVGSPEQLATHLMAQNT